MPLERLLRSIHPAWSGGIATIGLLGCGGNLADPVPPPPPPPSTGIVSYAAITGDWTGQVTELRTPNKYTILVRLSQEARKGESAAQITYAVTEAGFASDCHGVLAAGEAAAGVYAFSERISTGPCVQDGTVILTHDGAAGTLNYEWFNRSGVQCCEAVMKRP